MPDLIKAITEADKELQEPMSDKNPMWEAHDIEVDEREVMTDDIRVGIARGLSHNNVIEWEELTNKQYYLSEADRLINYLKSKNVVRLADSQEFPTAYGEGMTPTAYIGYKMAQAEVRKAGLRRVKNLDGTEL